MPLFPVLDFENLVQENDKTRIDASKSFASGTNAITVMTLAPFTGATPIDILSNGYLDWSYDFTIDVDATNNKVDFIENAGALAATLTSGGYTLSDLATEIALQMTAVGTLTYTGTVSGNVITITATGDFSLLGETGANVGGASILASIGFVEDTDLGASTVGEEITRITKTLTLYIENDVDPTPITATLVKTLSLISESEDMLFSTDDMLRKHESDIMKYVPDGRATFKDVHRRAQTLIMAWLDTHGFIDSLGNKLTVGDLADRDEVAEWSTMMVLRLIFESVSNAVDDIFREKSKKYQGLEDFYRNRATLKIKVPGATNGSTPEIYDIRSCRVVRR